MMNMRRIYDSKYFVTNTGSVISSKNDGKVFEVKPHFSKAGYCRVHLRINKIRKTFLVHRLVAIHFLPNDENKKEINHINGIKTDNNLENLEWVTKSENIIHAHKNGLINKKGEKNGYSKLTESNVINIRTSNKTVRQLCKIYHVTHSTIYHVKNFKTWNHL